MIYTLVNVYITMETHHFQWVNPLYMAIFNSYVCLPEGIIYIYTYNYIIYICMESPFWKPPKRIYLCLNLDSRVKIAWFNQQQQRAKLQKYANPPAVSPAVSWKRCQSFPWISYGFIDFIWISYGFHCLCGNHPIRHTGPKWTSSVGGQLSWGGMMTMIQWKISKYPSIDG